MIYVFAALFCEVKPLVGKYDMKPDGNGPFGSFVSPDGRIRVILTGMGKTGAAAAVAYACATYGTGADDFVLNIGSAAGGASRNGAYLINKVTDDDSGRSYYPDMLYNTGLRESAVTTVSKIATEEKVASDPGMLWEMEASGFFDAARLFMPPHRIQLIKAVSDSGHDSGKEITDAMLEETIGSSLDDIVRAIEVYLKVDEAESACVPDVSGLSDEFRCSETMRQDLIKLLIYCSNSGRDASVILDGMRSEGLIPAADRRSGKEALNEFKRRILQ